jgi:hypothetical protein
LVIWAGLVVAANIFSYRKFGRTLFGFIRKSFREDGIGSATVYVLALTVFLPLTLLFTTAGPFSGSYDQKSGVKDTLINFLLLIATFFLLLFINWQLRQHGW